MGQAFTALVEVVKQAPDGVQRLWDERRPDADRQATLRVMLTQLLGEYPGAMYFMDAVLGRLIERHSPFVMTLGDCNRVASYVRGLLVLYQLPDMTEEATGLVQYLDQWPTLLALSEAMERQAPSVGVQARKHERLFQESAYGHMPRDHERAVPNAMAFMLDDLTHLVGIVFHLLVRDASHLVRLDSRRQELLIDGHYG